MPKDEANRDFWANNMNANIDKLDLPYRKPEVIEKLKKASENVSEKHTTSASNTFVKRNAPHVCSFFAKGKCTRGSSCPYRHTGIK